MKLTETFNKATVAKGDVFEIELPALAGAGYLWEAEVVSGKAQLLKVGFKSVVDGMSVGEVGGAELQRFAFRAEETGEVEIKADYKRPWENTVEKSQTFKVTVK